MLYDKNTHLDIYIYIYTCLGLQYVPAHALLQLHSTHLYAFTSALDGYASHLHLFMNPFMHLYIQIYMHIVMQVACQNMSHAFHPAKI